MGSIEELENDFFSARIYCSWISSILLEVVNGKPFGFKYFGFQL